MKSVWQITFESWLLHCIPSEILCSTCDLHCLESFCMVWLFVICVIVCDVHLMVFILWVTNCGLWQTTVWSLQVNCIEESAKKETWKNSSFNRVKGMTSSLVLAKKQPVESEDNFSGWNKLLWFISLVSFLYGEQRRRIISFVELYQSTDV